jgi:hypothetical protein
MILLDTENFFKDLAKIPGVNTVRNNFFWKGYSYCIKHYWGHCFRLIVLHKRYLGNLRYI